MQKKGHTKDITDITDVIDRLESLDTKVDKIYVLIKEYMDETNWFVAESAGAIATLQNLYEEKGFGGIKS